MTALITVTVLLTVFCSEYDLVGHGVYQSDSSLPQSRVISLSENCDHVKRSFCLTGA